MLRLTRWWVVSVLGLPIASGLTRMPLVANHLSPNVLTLKDEDSLQDSARLLKRYHVTGAPVVDGSSLSGILSRNDLLVAIDKAIPSAVSASDFDHKILSLQQQQVWEVMPSELNTIHPDATLLTAARTLQEKKLNRLMAKSSYSSMLCIISSTDVVFALLKCDEAAAAQIDPSEFTFNCAAADDLPASDADREIEEELCAIGTSVETFMAKRVFFMTPSMTLKDAARVSPTICRLATI